MEGRRRRLTAIARTMADWTRAGLDIIKGLPADHDFRSATTPQLFPNCSNRRPYLFSSGPPAATKRQPCGIDRWPSNSLIDRPTRRLFPLPSSLSPPSISQSFFHRSFHRSCSIIACCIVRGVIESLSGRRASPYSVQLVCTGWPAIAGNSAGLAWHRSLHRLAINNSTYLFRTPQLRKVLYSPDIVHKVHT